MTSKSARRSTRRNASDRGQGGGEVDIPIRVIAIVDHLRRGNRSPVGHPVLETDAHVGRNRGGESHRLILCVEYPQAFQHLDYVFPCLM